MKELKEKMQGKSILIVDDNPMIRNSLKPLMSTFFENVYLAEHGLEALDILDNQKIDVVFTDHDMPEMNGTGLIESMKLCINKKEIPIILSSAREGYETLIEHLHDLLPKPLDIRTLIDSLKKI